MGDSSDIDRLIELGLNRYGAGDLDGALLLWEEALALDPDNAQATSYVDYVRINYDLLTSGDPSVENDDAPFAIEEEPEYMIEIIPERFSDPELAGSTADLPLAAAMISLDPIDAGWDVDETYDTRAVPADPQTPPDTDRPAEPPPPDELLELELAPSSREPAQPVSFDDATREYHGVVQRKLPGELSHTEPTHGDFNADEYTGGFTGPQQATPVGFATQDTGVRKRDLGFVQPTAKPALSDFEATQERGQGFATQDHASRFDSDSGETNDDELIDSLPTPRPAREPESGEIRIPGAKANTRELPELGRVPARSDSSAHSQAEVMLPHAPTRELSPNEIRAHALEPMLSAPTRELGLRPGKGLLDDDDAPTGQSDVRAIRAAAARNDGGAESAREGTRHDIVLPFDPIAAQAAQILDDVDANATPGESHEETTRRRITRLLELAGDWSEAGQLDKAVSAVDLALSEDPNSALGQKLITRNKDLVMSLFQSYLGNLDRMPQLARPLHELSSAPISPRAAFLLSRIDGTLSIDELLDVSGMPRLEAYRYLCQLFLRGILR